MHMHTRQGDAQTGGSPAGLLARPPDAKNDDRKGTKNDTNPRRRPASEFFRLALVIRAQK